MDPSFLQRLAFVKYLVSIATSQCRASEPLASAGLLTLHDAVELFLQLAAEHLNVTEKLQELKDYWKPIAARLPNGEVLSQQNAMQRLNKARVALKHHGTHPSKMDLSSFRSTAEAFFLENTPRVFNVSFDHISMTSFIEPADARAKVEEAERLRRTGDFNKAAEALAIAIAIEMMIGSHAMRGRERRSPYLFGKKLRTSHSVFSPQVFGRASQTMTDMAEAVASMQAAMRVMAVGIDFRKYSQFKALVPTATLFLNGTYQIYDWQGATRDNDTVQYCMDFVIEAAIGLQSVEPPV